MASLVKFECAVYASITKYPVTYQQNASEVSAVNITEEGTVYSHLPSEAVPFTITALVLTERKLLNVE